jgi:hypothetical protein
MTVFLAVFTLGVAPLGQWINERSWPKQVDDQGLLTRGGTRIAWSEFTRAVKVITRVNSGTIERYDLHSPQGKVVVAAYRLEDGDAVMNYIWQRLPDAAKYKQA